MKDKHALITNQDEKQWCIFCGAITPEALEAPCPPFDNSKLKGLSSIVGPDEYIEEIPSTFHDERLFKIRKKNND